MDYFIEFLIQFTKVVAISSTSKSTVTVFFAVEKEYFCFSQFDIKLAKVQLNNGQKHSFIVILI